MILMISGKINNWAFDTVPQTGLNGRIGYQPRGKGLGGSSAINAMVYIRGHRSDYDHWASLANTGWSYADVLPYSSVRKIIPSSMAPITARAAPSMSRGLRSDNPVREIYLQAARAAQFRIRDDFNAEEQEGLGSYQVIQKNGERWSAARAISTPISPPAPICASKSMRKPPESCSRISAVGSNTVRAMRRGKSAPAAK